MKNLLLLLCFAPVFASAQNFHLSFKGGLANYQGDLQAKRFTFNQAKFVGSIGARYDLTEHVVARTHLSLGMLRADDAKSKNTSQQTRNLNFQTNLFEWELGAQYNIFNLNYKWWTPYVFAGGALYHIKPFTADDNGAKVFLQPFSTEGQGFVPGKKAYNSTQFAIPFGIGAEYLLTEDLRIGLEIGYRKTFTDYIDDVSSSYVDQAALLAARGPQAVALAYRGNATYPAAGELRGREKNKDAYYFVQLTFVWRPFVDWYQRTSGIASFKKKNKKVGCPGVQARGF